jgi:protein O-GlcNAc transferase
MSPAPQPPAEPVLAKFERAVTLHRGQRIAEAAVLYSEILKSDPTHPMAAHNLGALFLQSKRPRDALPLLASAVKLEPGRAQNWITYLYALTEARHFEEAERVLADCRGRGLAGPLVDAAETRLQHAWALALNEAGRAAEAEGRLRRAIILTPGDAAIYGDLGLVLVILGRPQEAEASLRQALSLNPADVIGWSNLGGVQKQLNRHREAEASFRRALAIDPANEAALRNLGTVLKDGARAPEAREAFLTAARTSGAFEVSVQAHLALSAMTRGTDDITAQRVAYEAGLTAFRADPRAFNYAGGRDNCPWFWLAYHDQDDRLLLEATQAVLSEKVVGLDYVSPRLETWGAPASGRRIKVVIVSEFLRDHTIGRLYRGLVERLDRSRFEVVLAHSGNSHRDPFRDELDAVADAAIVLGPGLEAQRQAIEVLAPDVLFYPDIGMSAATYFLAYSRLAPVQATSWGHPNTTGLRTLDYFISGAGIEPPAAQALYTERLVTFDRLPSWYAPPRPPEPLPDRAALGLPPGLTLYGCPQSLFKFHPDFDSILAQIIEGDPNGRLVLLQAQSTAWTEVLRERWRVNHPGLLENALFLPRLSQLGFMAHLSHIDVLLDPLHFGSGNTLYEAMAFGTPIVTHPGRFMRGRIVAGAYRQMGVADAPIAERIEDYAPLALALGRDPHRRSRLRETLRLAALRELYRDDRALRAFERFFEDAVAAAARGERLSGAGA